MMYNNKASRGIAALLIATLLSVQCSLPMYSYADSIDTPEEITDIITEVIDTDEIAEDLEETPNEYIAESDDLSIEIPKDGGDGITIDPNEDEAVCMGLPKNVHWEEGVLSDGIITYGDENDDAAVGVHAIESEDGENVDGVRVLITINNKDADHDYSFGFNLPNGYRLIRAEDYYAQFDKSELNEDVSIYDGEVYIVNGKNEVSQVIEPAWAKDANGDPVETHYTIKGNTLVQHVAFNEDTAFPVVADPSTSNGWKTITVIKNKKEMKKCIEGKKTNADICKLLMHSAAAKLPAIAVIPSQLLLVMYGDKIVDATKAQWDKVLKDFNKSGFAFVKLTEKVRIRRPYVAPKTMKIVFTNSH